MHSLVSELGLPLNHDKAQGPCKRLDIMGIAVDITDLSVSIPESKMTDIVDTCEQVSRCDSITKKDLQSLLYK